MDAENPVPSAVRNVAIVEVKAAGRKMRVWTSSWLRQSSMIGRPKKPSAQVFISPATCSQPGEDRLRANASRRLRWLSSAMHSVCPSASSPSNIQPSRADRSA